MGRLIDADGAKEILYVSKERITNNLSNQITSFIRENYIPKADYENRLKADMAAMLDELDLELCKQYDDTDLIKVKYVRQAIQQKINKLKGGNDGL